MFNLNLGWEVVKIYLSFDKFRVKFFKYKIKKKTITGTYMSKGE